MLSYTEYLREPCQYVKLCVMIESSIRKDCKTWEYFNYAVIPISLLNEWFA
jgi:hypothetical protein